MEHRSPWMDFKDRIHHISELPPPTADDLEYEKDPEAYERREMAKAWKEEQPDFKRLKRLASALGVGEVLVSPTSVNPELQGLYNDGWDSVWHPSGWGPSPDEFELAKEWGLSRKKIRSLNRRGDAVIFINYWNFERGGCYVLAHEIGHHVYQLARFTWKEQKRPVQRIMRRYFRWDTYVHQTRDEMCAECFAEFLTCSNLRRGVAKHCESILQRLRVQNPRAAKLIEMHRHSSVSEGASIP